MTISEAANYNHGTDYPLFQGIMNSGCWINFFTLNMYIYMPLLH